MMHCRAVACLGVEKQIINQAREPFLNDPGSEYPSLKKLQDNVCIMIASLEPLF